MTRRGDKHKNMDHRNPYCEQLKKQVDQLSKQLKEMQQQQQQQQQQQETDAAPHNEGELFIA